MGQYYVLSCPERRENLIPREVCGGVKMWEILNNGGGVSDSLLILLSHQETPSQAPGDVYVPGITGRWAGSAAMYVGDYAEEGDLEPWPYDIPEDEIYGATYSNKEEIEEGENPRSVDTLGLYTSIGKRVQKALERVIHMVYVTVPKGEKYEDRHGKERVIDWERTHKYRVVRKENGRYTPDKNDSECWDENYAGIGINIIESREDIVFLDHAEMHQGQTRLIVNLDKKEYIDPVAFGETPTLACMIMKNTEPKYKEGPHGYEQEDIWTSSQALSQMLFFNEGRGGGDMNGETVGRWRGDRIVVLGDNPTKKYPSHSDIREEYADISELAKIRPE